MSRMLAIAGAVLGTAALLADAGAAARAAATSNEVFVGGTVILRVREAAGGFSPEQRAASIQERVNRLLGTGPIQPSDVTVEPMGSEAVVRVKGQLLFTADQQTAKLNQSTPMELANTWADHMRQVLPSLTRPTG